MKRTNLMLAAAAILAAAGQTHSAEVISADSGADWPQWRGPTRDGIASNCPKLLDSWPKDGPKLLWKSEPIPGGLSAGAGSISVADGKAFVFLTRYINKSKDEQSIRKALNEVIDELSRDPKLPPDRAARLAKLKEDQSKLTAWIDLAHLVANYFGDQGPWMLQYPVEAKLFEITDNIICMDASTGKTLWEASFPAMDGRVRKIYGYYSASGTPSIYEHKCYIGGSVGLYCLNAEDGKVVWQEKAEFTSSSPMVANGVVYVALPEGLCARDAENGKLIWKTTAIRGHYDAAYGKTVVLWNSGGKDYLIGLTSEGLFCCDPVNGKVAWSVAGVGHSEGSSSVAIRGDTAVFCGHHGIYAFKLSPQKGEQLWMTPWDSYRAGSTLVWQDLVYAASDHTNITCLDLKSGTVKWTGKQVSSYCSPVEADGKIILPRGTNTILSVEMFRATPEGYVNLGSFLPYVQGHGMVPCSSPALAGGKLYLRLEDGVACYDLRAAGK